MVTEAQKRATAKYNKKKYVSIGMKLKPEEKELIDNHIIKTGESFTAFIIRSAKTQIEIDNQIKSG